MAYSQQDRVWIRHFLGFSSTFYQFDPRLENAISATQAEGDGGTLPDSSTENNVKGLVYGFAAVTTGTTGVTPGPTAQSIVFNTPARIGLVQLQANLDLLMASQGATEADGGDVKLDVAREDRRIRNQGRAMVQEMCRILGMKAARADIFSPSKIDEYDDPFVAQASLTGI